MSRFSNDIVDLGRSGSWRAEQIMAVPHSHRRGDMWPPFADSPFGSRLLHALADLGPLLLPLLGEDAALDF
eukprot:5558725-Prymnesium_polylepis.1